MDSLKIATFNCKHFDGSFKESFCKELLDVNDFLLIQEHWLYQDNFHKFDKISKDYLICKHGASSMDPTVIRSGRPYGGCIILWKGNINYSIKPINILSCRLNCIQVSSKVGFTFLLFNVYMPTDERGNGEHLSEYQDILAEISTISRSISTSFIVIAGDFNTDFLRNSPQARELKSFREAENLISCKNFPGNNVEFSYECKTTGNRSLIDHILITENIENFICNFKAKESLDNLSDHIPLSLDLNINCNYLKTKEITHQAKVAWYRVNINDTVKYKSCLDKELRNIKVPHEALQCKLLHCTEHDIVINEFHNNIVNACLSAGYDSLPITGDSTKGSHKNSTRAGWNDYCRDKKK